MVTGVYLMFYYRPTAEYAYADMKYLEFDMPFGMLMRNMHRWAAHGMVIAVWLHMFQIFWPAPQAAPGAQLDIGVILLVLTLLLSLAATCSIRTSFSIRALTVARHGAGHARCSTCVPFHEVFGIDPIYDTRVFLFRSAE